MRTESIKWYAETMKAFSINKHLYGIQVTVCPLAQAGYDKHDHALLTKSILLCMRFLKIYELLIMSLFISGLHAYNLKMIMTVCMLVCRW